LAPLVQTPRRHTWHPRELRPPATSRNGRDHADFWSSDCADQAAFRALLALALGIAALAWPGITIAAAVALCAIDCFADAIAQLMRLFNANDTVSQRAVMILRGAFDVAAGVVAIVYPGITAGALVIVIGAWAILGGTVELAAAWNIRGPGPGG
jgi:uncharacterized membrane protein HdeD (DUF308 family)